ncbi:MAG: hypothetical protein KIS66_11400 [Fimbriimonadaceae bacterium]|nr:hypothetical protein [Fimbriimonadaceae bacterium]
MRRLDVGPLIVLVLAILVGCQKSEPTSVVPPKGTSASQSAPATAADDVTAKQISFEATDGATAFADLYTARRGSRTVALLFHQAGSNAGEYATLAPLLCGVGMDCLAVDQRSGGTMWGRDNRTVQASGRSAEYVDAYADLEGALRWARSQGKYGRVLVAGSSYSASLCFRLGVEHPGIAAILAFSPGEYLPEPGTVERWAKAWRGPLFVSCSPEEAIGDAKRLFDACAGTSDAPTRLATHPGGVHGASAFRSDKCQVAKEYADDLFGFLNSLRPKRTTVGAITEPTTE